MSRESASKVVAVVVPLSMRSELTSDEQISLRHLNHFLRKYDKYMIAPKKLCAEFPGFEIKRFNDRFFGSAQAHVNLLFSPQFYQSFLEYKYILIYHLDALVFSDQLLEWCDTDLDYIGAPWIKHESAPYHGLPYFEGKVGNGGFSLRKVGSFLKVLSSSRYSKDPGLYASESSTLVSRSERWAMRAKGFLKYWKRINNLQWEISRPSHIADDAWWANRANYYYPEFKIASVEEALRFAFECVPQHCFELTNHTLPFGCHAWPHYDRKFWEPYLLK